MLGIKSRKTRSAKVGSDLAEALTMNALSLKVNPAEAALRSEKTCWMLDNNDFFICN